MDTVEESEPHSISALIANARAHGFFHLIDLQIFDRISDGDGPTAKDLADAIGSELTNHPEVYNAIKRLTSRGLVVTEGRYGKTYHPTESGAAIANWIFYGTPMPSAEETAA